MATRTKAGDTAWLDRHDLSDRYRAFVLAYIVSKNATKAAEEAGYKHPSLQGHRLLRNEKVRAAVDQGLGMVEKKMMIDAESIAKHWLDIATADPNEITSNMVGACRYCHGQDHEFQWKTEREFREALGEKAASLFADSELCEAAIAGQITDPRLPSDAGGYGYRITDDPDPTCPECAGLGIEYVRMADTRRLKGAARLLFDGVEETRQGKKIRTQDRAKALENLAKHLGMFTGKVDSEETSPLERLAQRLMDAASPVPVSGGILPSPPEAATHAVGRTPGTGAFQQPEEEP